MYSPPYPPPLRVAAEEEKATEDDDPETIVAREAARATAVALREKATKARESIPEVPAPVQGGNLPERHLEPSYHIMLTSGEAPLASRRQLLWLAAAELLVSQGALMQLVAIAEASARGPGTGSFVGRGPDHDVVLELPRRVRIIDLTPVEEDDAAFIKPEAPPAEPVEAKDAEGEGEEGEGGEGGKEADVADGDAEGEGEEGEPVDPCPDPPALIFGVDPYDPQPVQRPSALPADDSIALTRAALDSAARAAFRARGAEAWGVVRNAARVAWNALWAGWVAPYRFAPPTKHPGYDPVAAAEEAAARRQAAAKAKADAAAAAAAAAAEAGEPAPEAEADEAVEEVEAEAEADLDWRPLLRVTMVVLDLFEAITATTTGKAALEAVWGAGKPAEEEEEVEVDEHGAPLSADPDGDGDDGRCCGAVVARLPPHSNQSSLTFS